MTAMTLTHPATSPDDARWRAVAARDRSADGMFVVAVHSTRIYCRPSCPSRLPRREGVSFFATPAQARAAGYRACKRCHPDAAPADPAAGLVARACDLIAREGEHVPLSALAARAGANERALHRAFKRVLGLTPKQYADTLRLRRLKDGLRANGDVTRSLYDAGYGSPSRLYESATQRLGMTPATYGKRGKGAEIAYAIVPSPLGRLLVAATPHGICAIIMGEDDGDLEAKLHAEFSAAKTITRDDDSIGDWVRDVTARLSARSRTLTSSPLPLDVRGTAFQRLVWQELMAVPPGSTRTYTEIAEKIGRPSMRRAVARACATNPVPIVVPCHRIVRSDGGLGGYAYGLDRKELLLDIEAKAARRRSANGRPSPRTGARSKRADR